MDRVPTLSQIPSIVVVSQGKLNKGNSPDPTSGTYPCPDCGKFLSRQDSLIRHARVIHGAIQDFQCQQPECVRAKKGFRRLHDYKRHMWLVHDVDVSVIDSDSDILMQGAQRSSGLNVPRAMFQNTQQSTINRDGQKNARPYLKGEHQASLRLMPRYPPKGRMGRTPQRLAPYVPDLGYQHGPAFKPRDMVGYWGGVYVPDLDYRDGPAFKPGDELQVRPVQTTEGVGVSVYPAAYAQRTPIGADAVPRNIVTRQDTFY